MPGGTSAATAFVAGVASAMMSKWPATYYTQPVEIKRRLQITSTPFASRIENSKVSSGILNPDLAMENPSLSYVRTKSAGLAIADKPEWCVDQIKVSRDGQTADDIVDIRTIYRIVCATLDHCIVFHSDIEQWAAGIVERSGPGAIKGNILQVDRDSTLPDKVDLKDPVLFTTNGIPYRANQFTDFVLHAIAPHVGQRTCPP
jgi:hypothetical protein